jgi:hypothetical protein
MRARSAIMVVAVLISLEAIPGVAAAEIVDKEPALAVTWTWALVGGAIGLVGWRFRWWAGAVLAVPPAAYFAVLHFELTDSQVGPAMVAEAGHEYLFWSYGAVATFAVLHLAGLWRAVRRRHVTS